MVSAKLMPIFAAYNYVVCPTYDQLPAALQQFEEDGLPTERSRHFLNNLEHEFARNFAPFPKSCAYLNDAIRDWCVLAKPGLTEQTPPMIFGFAELVTGGCLSLEIHPAYTRDNDVAPEKRRRLPEAIDSVFYDKVDGGYFSTNREVPLGKFAANIPLPMFTWNTAERLREDRKMRKNSLRAIEEVLGDPNEVDLFMKPEDGRLFLVNYNSDSRDVYVVNSLTDTPKLIDDPVGYFDAYFLAQFQRKAE